MSRSIFNIFSRVWGVMMSTTTTWDHIDKEETQKNDVFKRYVLPWIFICIIFTFTFQTLYASTKPIENGILNSIAAAISLLGGYYISIYISWRLLHKRFQSNDLKILIEKIIGYSFSIIFIIRVIIEIIPSLYFLRILNIYTAYLVWEACRSILKLNEDERGNIVLIISACILFAPFIINKILSLMIPQL